MIDITTITKTNANDDGWHVEIHVHGDPEIITVAVGMIKNMIRALDYVKRGADKKEGK